MRGAAALLLGALGCAAPGPPPRGIAPSAAPAPEVAPAQPRRPALVRDDLPVARGSSATTEPCPTLAVVDDLISLDGAEVGRVSEVLDLGSVRRLDGPARALVAWRAPRRAPHPTPEHPGCVALSLPADLPALVVKTLLVTAASASHPHGTLAVRSPSGAPGVLPVEALSGQPAGWAPQLALDLAPARGAELWDLALAGDAPPIGTLKDTVGPDAPEELAEWLGSAVVQWHRTSAASIAARPRAVLRVANSLPLQHLVGVLDGVATPSGPIGPHGESRPPVLAALHVDEPGPGPEPPRR